MIPFDIIPRLMLRSEWTSLEAGLVQRVKALNHFLADIYGAQEIIRAGRIPADLVAHKDLCDHVAKLEREEAKADADTIAVADNVLSRIRQGLAWTIVPNKPLPDYSAELTVARGALGKLDVELAEKNALLEKASCGGCGERGAP